ncbi:hypothetical protein G6729_01685 [Polynucleobacter paneuropaeus]|nr:hypothetical protein G6729_01685 [Polynucleobacter paneuropaeus]
MYLESIFFLISVIAIKQCVKKRYYLLFIYNLLIFYTYGVKPFFSCMGYFVVYNGCENNDYSSYFYIPLFAFYFGQIFDLRLRRRVYILQNYPRIESVVFLSVIVGLYLIWSWGGALTFQDFDGQRILSAKTSAFVNILATSLLLGLIISMSYKKLLISIYIGIFVFLATGTKQFFFLPILMFYSKKFNGNINIFNLIKMAIFFIAALFIAQIFRSSGGVFIEVEKIPYIVSIPFDAYDNGLNILRNIDKFTFMDFMLPFDSTYALESILSYFPRDFWLEKPEVMGFWRIQRDYLPLLYSGTSGMSASISMPIDIIFGYGLAIGSTLCIIISIVLKAIDNGSVKVGFLYPLILMYSIEFSRAGFRSSFSIILQAVIIYFLYLIMRLFKSCVSSKDL